MSVATLLVAVAAWQHPFGTHPKLTVIFEEISLNSEPPKFAPTYAIVTGHILNSGSPTSIQEFHLDYIGPKGNLLGSYIPDLLTEPRNFGKSLLYRESGEHKLVPSVVVRPEDGLDKRTLKPIETGGQIYGRLIFNINIPVTQCIIPRAKYVLRVVDVEGNVTEGIYLIGSTTPRDPFPYPDLKPIE